MTKRRPGNQPFYGWVVAFAAMFIIFAGYGIQYSFGVFFKPVLTDFGWSRAATAGALSLYMVAHGISSVFMGGLADKYGARRPAMAGGVLFGLAMVLLSRLSAIWQLYVLWGLAAGVATGAMYAPLAATISKWFTKKRGSALGVMTSGIGTGT